VEEEEPRREGARLEELRWEHLPVDRPFLVQVAEAPKSTQKVTDGVRQQEGQPEDELHQGTDRNVADGPGDAVRLEEQEEQPGGV
jgi:hypothetical protein